MNSAEIAALTPLEFGMPGEFRQWIVGEILSGRKTGTTNLAVGFDALGISGPRVGELRALVDSTNHRVAVVRFTEVVRTSSATVTEEITRHESPSIEAWRVAHHDYWTSLVPTIQRHLDNASWQLTDDEPAISAVFEVVEAVEAPPSTAFIGAGFHASTNILPAAVLGGVRIQAIATRSSERSAAALRRFGSDGIAYASADALLTNPAISNVVVIAQPTEQAALVLEAIAAGKNVFVEKPLGYSGAEAAAIATAAQQAGVAVSVGFMKRHAPAYRQLGGLLASGELGQITSFHLTFGCDSTPFCTNQEDFLKLAAIHVVDLVRFLFGEVAAVHTLTNSAGPLVSMAVSLRFESGVIGTLDLSGLPSYSSETEILRVVGSTGIAIVTDLTELSIHRVDPAVATTGPGWRSLTEGTVVLRPAESAMSGVERDLYLRGFVAELVDFAAGVESPSSALDNVLTMELCDRILNAESSLAASKS